VSLTRKKTDVPVVVHLGTDALNLLKDLPGEGPLFPYLGTLRAGDRATEFGQRCRQLGIKRRYVAQLPLRVDETGQSMRLPGKIRPGGAGAQLEGRPSRVCNTGVDEASVLLQEYEERARTDAAKP
jgi:hypothetical protein